MTNSEIKIKNSFNLPSYSNTLYEIESNEDFLKVDCNKFDEFLKQFRVLMESHPRRHVPNLPICGHMRLKYLQI